MLAVSVYGMSVYGMCVLRNVCITECVCTECVAAGRSYLDAVTLNVNVTIAVTVNLNLLISSGGVAAEMLARSGVGSLLIIDTGVVEDDDVGR